MFNQDFFLRSIEDFFKMVKKLVNADLDEKSEDFEKQVNELLNNYFNLDISNFIKNQNNLDMNALCKNFDKQYLALLFLKIAKYYELKNDDISKSYFLFARKVLNHKSSVFFYKNDDLENKVNEYLENNKY